MAGPMEERSTEFWQEESEDTRRDLRRLAIRCAVIFGAMIAGLAFMIWRSHAAVELAASRIEGRAVARYRLFGVVRHAQTGQPIPWPVLTDEVDSNTSY